jgi:inorganic pyrophosphatase
MHPWHGISQTEKFPNEIIAFIEIIPTDTVKYEVDKLSGYLKIDRPQKYSNIIPALYGFIPKTYCGKNIAHITSQYANQDNIKGDGDPLDICVLTEKSITHGDILVDAIPIGGFTLLDKNEADDKIIAILKGDAVYGNIRNLDELPKDVIDRLKHYFLTYKQMPNEKSIVTIINEYNREEAINIIKLSFEDYINEILPEFSKDKS